jgi:hypothetical protein
MLSGPIKKRSKLNGGSWAHRDGVMGHRAVFDADAAPGAAVHVHTPGPFFDLDLEISGLPLHGFKIRIGD